MHKSTGQFGFNDPRSDGYKSVNFSVKTVINDILLIL